VKKIGDFSGKLPDFLRKLPDFLEKIREFLYKISDIFWLFVGAKHFSPVSKKTNNYLGE